MDFQDKILSKELASLLWGSHTVGTAESCTAGRIAEALAMTAGASDYFRGSIVCYHDDIKRNLLHVDPAVIAAKTAVCEEVAIQMVKGACERLSVEYAIATTGWAGPSGGTADNPVGTIYIAVGNKEKVVSMKQTEDKGRDANIHNATHNALQLLLEFINENAPKEISEEGAVKLVDLEEN